MAEPEAARGNSVGLALSIVGYVIGGILVILGGISWGLQLILMPIGLALIFAVALRRDPPWALAFLGGCIGVSLASWFSYSWGLAESIFQPHPALLLGFVSALAFLGYGVGRSIARTA